MCDGNGHNLPERMNLTRYSGLLICCYNKLYILTDQVNLSVKGEGHIKIENLECCDCYSIYMSANTRILMGRL